MKMKSLIAPAAASIVALTTGAGAAPQPTPSHAEVRALDPVKVAGIRKLANGSYEMTTQWLPYTGAGVDEQDTLVYDSAQVDDTGTPVGGTECGIPDGNRYFLEYTQGEADFQNANSVSNMTIADEFAGVQSGRATFLYYWTDTGSTFYVALFTAEDVSTDCSVPASDNVYDGIIYGFNSAPTGLYYTHADTSGDGLFLTMPSDGEGAHIFIIADFFDGQTLTLAAGPTQPALYGTSNNGGIPGRPGESADPTWADVNTDGELTDDECFSYAYGACPDPFTNGVAFWTEGEGGNECYADCDGDTVLNLFDFLCFVNEFNIQSEYSNCNGDGAIDLFDFLCYVNAFNTGC
jgi:hypothetical protein